MSENLKPRSLASRTDDIHSPEHAGNEALPPRPGHPRYRVEAGQCLVLATVNPDKSEHHPKKKAAAGAGLDRIVVPD